MLRRTPLLAIATVVMATVALTAASAQAAEIYVDDFSGSSGSPLNGTTPDVSTTGESWVAAPTFEANGDSVDPGTTGNAGGSATLAFTPLDGTIYTLEAAFENIVGDTDWFAVGFANGQSSANNSNSRFITGSVVGIGWAMYRGMQTTGSNQTFLGDLTDLTNPGLGPGGTPWLVDGTAAGGNAALRLTLDTTGGAGAWTILMEADTGSGFQTIRATETLLDETITSVGIANANANDLTGTLTSFKLIEIPEPASMALLGLGGLMLFRRRRIA